MFARSVSAYHKCHGLLTGFPTESVDFFKVNEHVFIKFSYALSFAILLWGPSFFDPFILFD